MDYFEVYTPIGRHGSCADLRVYGPNSEVKTIHPNGEITRTPAPDASLLLVNPVAQANAIAASKKFVRPKHRRNWVGWR